MAILLIEHEVKKRAVTRIAEAAKKIGRFMDTPVYVARAGFKIN
jgi:hypothetical protein